MTRLAALLLLLTACSAQPSKPIIQYKTIEVPVFLRAPIPQQYTQDCVVVEPQPAAGKWFTNGQVAELVDMYRGALAQCNADKAALRSLQPTEDSH